MVLIVDNELYRVTWKMHHAVVMRVCKQNLNISLMAEIWKSDFYLVNVLKKRFGCTADELFVRDCTGFIFMDLYDQITLSLH